MAEAEELQLQRENLRAQLPMKRDEQDSPETYLTDPHSPEVRPKRRKLDSTSTSSSSCESGRLSSPETGSSDHRLSRGQLALVDVQTADDLNKQLKKMEKKKQKWKDKYQKLIEKKKESDPHESGREAPLTEDINRLKEENSGLKAKVKELEEKNQKLTSQVLDLKRRFPAAAAPPNSETEPQ